MKVLFLLLRQEYSRFQKRNLVGLNDTKPSSVNSYRLLHLPDIRFTLSKIRYENGNMSCVMPVIRQK